jgi:uncharacterized protein (TIGR01777 family)
MRVAITGASGLIGTALRRHLTDHGHEVVPVVRSSPGDGEIGWSITEKRIDDAAFEDIDAVVHLAGAGIGDARWTDERKSEILESRTVGTSLIAQAINDATNPPSVLLSGSAIGFYGSSPDKTFDENDEAGDGFLAEVCVAWESAAAPAQIGGTRIVFLRTGIVLSPEGGALKKQLPLFKLGLGGKIGDGTPWQSWISIDDEVAAIRHLLTSSVAGPADLTAPNPVRQSEFADTLGDVLGRPTFLPIPGFGPKLALGSELAENLLLKGQRVLPTVLENDGFEFQHPDLEPALRALLDR